MCTGATVEFRDITGGADKTLCGASVDGRRRGHLCDKRSELKPGARTVRSVVVIAGGICTAGASSGSISHTVNAAPAAVPTVGEWTLWGFTGLLLIGGGVFASRRFRATAA